MLFKYMKSFPMALFSYHYYGFIYQYHRFAKESAKLVGAKTLFITNFAPSNVSEPAGNHHSTKGRTKDSTPVPNALEGETDLWGEWM